MQCQINTILTKKRSAKNMKPEPCKKDAVCIIRINGREYMACANHKTGGVFVRPLKGK